MTSNTAQPGHHHLSTAKIGLALGGAVLAVGAGYGISALVLDDPVPAAPTAPGSRVEPDWGEDPNGFRGTNREERALMHRR